MEIEVVGSAVECAAATVAPAVVVAGSDGEVGAASTVNPNAAPDDAPSTAVNASGIAPLADEFDTTVRVDGAEVPIEIV